MSDILRIDDVCSGHPMAIAELATLRQIATQANARLLILRKAMRETDWQHLCQDYKGAELWFDNEGLANYRNYSRIDI